MFLFFNTRFFILFIKKKGKKGYVLKYYLKTGEARKKADKFLWWEGRNKIQLWNVSGSGKLLIQTKTITAGRSGLSENPRASRFGQADRFSSCQSLFTGTLASSLKLIWKLIDLIQLSASSIRCLIFASSLMQLPLICTL